MRSDSERDISKAKSEGDCRARSAGGRRSIAVMGAVEVAGGGKRRGVADAWRFIGGQSPSGRIAELVCACLKAVKRV